MNMYTLTTLGRHAAFCAVDLPTVGSYCEEYGLMFRSLPRALYIGLQDRGANAVGPYSRSSVCTAQFLPF